MQLTLKQWFANSPDRRAIIDRQRYVIYRLYGETLKVPVTIIDEEEEK